MFWCPLNYGPRDVLLNIMTGVRKRHLVLNVKVDQCRTRGEQRRLVCAYSIVHRSRFLSWHAFWIAICWTLWLFGPSFVTVRISMQFTLTFKTLNKMICVIRKNKLKEWKVEASCRKMGALVLSALWRCTASSPQMVLRWFLWRPRHMWINTF